MITDFTLLRNISKRYGKKYKHFYYFITTSTVLLTPSRYTLLFFFPYSISTSQETQILQEDFVKERDILAKKFAAEKKDLQSVINHIESEEQNRENDAKYAFEQLREEIRNRALEEINMLRILLDGQIEELEDYFEAAHLHYLQQTAQRTHEFKALTSSSYSLDAQFDTVIIAEFMIRVELQFFQNIFV